MKTLLLLSTLVLLVITAFGQSVSKPEYGFSRTKSPFRWADNTPAGCPFPKSQFANRLLFTDRYANYTNGDTWYPSWADDDALYSPWTDGYILRTDVFEPFKESHPGLACNSLDFMGRKAATGNAKIVGNDPLNLQIVPLGRTEGAPAPYGGRYPCGSLVHNGVWYYGTYCLTENPNNICGGNGWTEIGPFVGFRTSTDYGKTWQETPHTPAKPIFGENPAQAKVKIGSPHFVDFGKDMQHSPDGYAYLTAHGATNPTVCNNWIQGDEIYLIRVKPSRQTINDPNAYEYFAGNDPEGNAIWSRTFADIKPLLKWDGHLGCVTATYNPGLKKYLMCISRGIQVEKTDKGPTNLRYDTMILEADALTGNWKLVQYLDRFGPMAYFVNIPSKFISADGRTMWLSYSANWDDKNRYGNPAGSYYSFSLHEITL